MLHRVDVKAQSVPAVNHAKMHFAPRWNMIAVLEQE
jgi:hypothetical protein